ncbi:MAG TPA: hypothetical protein VFJ43_07495, partial [Bacteroidia bacterium]|nr:hypothetical protein [Bacteroidia bacterium]
MKKTKLFLTALLLMAGMGMRAQSLSPQVVSSGGDFFPGGGTSLSTTFGELSITTLMSGNMLTQGFQQPDDLGMSVVTLHNNNSVNVYPNPTTDFITVSLSDNHSGVINAIL